VVASPGPAWLLGGVVEPAFAVRAEPGLLQ
jgi:hypothetical protein